MSNIDDLISKSYYLESNNPLGDYIRDLHRVCLSLEYRDSLVAVPSDRFRTAVKEEIDRVESVLASYIQIEYDKTFKVKKLIPPDRLIDKDQWDK
jgi:hypothetical protein